MLCDLRPRSLLRPSGLARERGRDVESPDLETSVSRRRILKRMGAGAALAWTAPIFTSVRPPAFAGSPAPCDEGCGSLAPYFRLPDLNCDCSECDGGCVGCGTCGCAQSCSRITSAEMLPDGSIRFCTDCVSITPSGGGNAGWDCSAGGCFAAIFEVDPNDPSCGIIPGPDPCPSGARFVSAHFACHCP
jgi:hypothetical protein